MAETCVYLAECSMADTAVDGLDRTARAERLPTGLRSTVIRPGRGAYEPFVHLVLLEAGEITVDAGDGSREAEAPAALILPPGPGVLLTLGPGSDGWLLGMGPSLLSAAVGARAESEFLAPIGTHLMIARDFAPDTATDPAALAERIADELSRPAPGAQMAVLAGLRLLLIDIWRSSGSEPQRLAQGSDAHVLLSFRRLVELHFHKRLGVADYAAQLGVTYDRLHGICQRNLQRAPLQLIHARMMREAASWLERSGQPIQQIAHALGFPDSAEFSHFFKRQSGLSPSRFRQQVRNQSEAIGLARTSFADWP